ncbi:MULTISPECIES: RICIN domain-containing protein [Micromonospora]|uniref:RICIN domain-containing protein n=1 Tax=Micromonospora TaxID=1873 RepID=UPI001EE8F653|nr:MULTISPECIES: RICIN domain-containing protein [Micromonospora]MCG5451636.1 RICIN domain-containing protein [Micromonospora hortensis]MCX5116849.1 RICIN domain-containing protein [Micromonospora sp. NBC_00362]
MKRRTMTGLVATLAMIAATLVGTGSPAAAATTGPWVIQPFTNDYCIHPEAYASASGTVVDQHLCDRGLLRNWNFTTTSSGYYHISYRNGGKCMAVRNASKTEREKIVTQGCGDARLNDQWLPIKLFTSGFADYYQLKNRGTGKCMAVEGNSTQNGADMMQFTCYTTSNNQAFTWGLD